MPIQCFIHVKSIWRKQIGSTHWEISVFFVQAGYMILLQHQFIHFLLCYLSSGRLREAKTRGKFQTFSSKSDRGRLQEIPNSYLTLKLLVFWKAGRWGEMVATGYSTVVYNSRIKNVSFIWGYSINLRAGVYRWDTKTLTLYKTSKPIPD